MLARAALLAAAVAAIVLLGRSLSAHDRCQSARALIFRATLERVPAGYERAAIAQVRASCAGDTGLIATAGALAAQGRGCRAIALALEAVRAEPRDARAWRTLGLVAQRAQAPALARAAERRLSTLDPLGQRSFSRNSGRSSR